MPSPKRPTETIQCLVCKTEFPKKGKRTLCSHACRRTRMLELLRKNYSERKGVAARKKTCPVCNSTFEGAHGNRLYCSLACYDEAGKKRAAGRG